MKLLRSFVIFLLSFVLITGNVSAQNVERIFNQIKPKNNIKVLDNSGRIVCDAWHLDSIVNRKLSERLSGSDADIAEKIRIRKEIWREEMIGAIKSGYTQIVVTNQEEVIESLEKPGGGFWLKSTGQIKSKLAQHTTLLNKPGTNQYIIALSPDKETQAQREGGGNKLTLSVNSNSDQTANNNNSRSNEEGIFGVGANNSSGQKENGRLKRRDQSDQDYYDQRTGQQVVKNRTAENTKIKVYVDFQNVTNQYLNQNAIIHMIATIFDKKLYMNRVVIDIKDQADEILLISDVTYHDNSKRIEKPGNRRYNNTVDEADREARRPLSRIDGVGGDLAQAGAAITSGVLRGKIKKAPSTEQYKVKIDFAVTLSSNDSGSVIFSKRTYRSFLYLANEDPEYGGIEERGLNTTKYQTELENNEVVPDDRLIEESRITAVAIAHEVLVQFDNGSKDATRR